MQYTKQILKLEQCCRVNKDLQKEVEKLLEQTQPLDFIARCNILLLENKFLNIPDVEHPSYVTGVDDIEFQDLLHDHVLGHFDVAPRFASETPLDNDSDTKPSEPRIEHKSVENEIVEQGQINPTMKQKVPQLQNCFSSDLPDVGSGNRSLKEQKSEENLHTLEKESQNDNSSPEFSKSSVFKTYMLDTELSSQQILRGSQTSLQSLCGSQPSLESLGNTNISDNVSISSFKSEYSNVPHLLQIVSNVHLKTFQEINLERFSSALIERDSMWIADWNQNVFRRKYTVLLNVRSTDYKTIQKEENRDSDADKKIVLLSFGDCILYAKKGNQAFSASIVKKEKSKKFSTAIISSFGLRAAMIRTYTSFSVIN